MTDPQKKRPPTKREIDLAEKESRFVDETGYGITVDNSEREGEPFDFGIVDDDEDNAGKDAA